MSQVSPPVTKDDIERFRIRARQIRAQAELTTLPAVRQELSETALAYERMAARGERLLTGG
jgi:hypothetical protein